MVHSDAASSESLGHSTFADATISGDLSVASSAEDKSTSSSARVSLRTSGSTGHYAKQSGTLRQSSKSNASRFLSELTVNKLQFLKLGRLYGRDREALQLREAWEDVRLAFQPKNLVATDHKPQGTTVRRFVTVQGASGTGKTSLVVETLQRFVSREGGFFLQGKFPQQLHLSRSAVEPYTALAAACSDLCELVLSLHTHPTRCNGGKKSVPNDRGNHLNFTLSEFRDRLQSELGPDGSLLARVIPGLLLLLSSPEEVLLDSHESEMPSYQESQHQLKQTFRRFLRVVASFGPTVLVLDDLQWADAASMELLEAVVSDRENTSLMVIGCYRDDEMYSNMPHKSSIENIKQLALSDSGLKMDEISIGNLNPIQVNELLVDLLSSSECETLGLAECVHKKTLGNIFFVIQFLTVLQESELLVYNIGVLKWTWDQQAIQLSMAATENVVSLMKTKMKSLPAVIQRILPIMACLGSTFSFSVIRIVIETMSLLWDEIEAETPSEQATAAPDESLTWLLLKRCEHEGLVEAFGDDASSRSYFWVHDKIQEAAFSLISENELLVLKLQLGETLYSGFTPSELQKNLFTVVNLLDSESDEATLRRRKPIEIAALHLRAGIKAMESSAFEQAAGYLLIGVGLLPQGHWTSHYELSLDLYSAAAEAEFGTGNFEKMKLYCDEVLAQENRPVLDKKRVYEVMILAKGGEQHAGDALDLCRSVLAQLGCTFPTHLVQAHVLAGVVRFRSTIKSITPEQISERRAEEDETNTFMLTLLDHFVTYSYVSKSDLLPLCIFKWLRITINDGVSSMSPIVFNLVSFILVAFFEDYKGGLAYADHSLVVLKQVKASRKTEGRVGLICHSIVFHWLRPIALSMKALLANYSLSMAIGFTDTATWSIYYYIEYSLHTGMPLEVVIADCAFYAEQVREVKQLKTLELMLGLWQCALHLTGEDPFDELVSGEILRQEEVLQTSANDYKIQHANIYRLQMYMAFVFGKYALVYETIRKTDMDNGYFDTMLQARNDLCHIYAFNGLSMVSLFRETNDRKYLKMGKKFAAKIKSWAKAGVSAVVSVYRQVA